MRVCCKCGEEIFPGQQSKGSGKRARHFKPCCRKAKAIHSEVAAPHPYEGLSSLGPAERMVSAWCSIAVSRVERQCHACAEMISKERQRARLSGEGDHSLEFEDLLMDLIFPGDMYERQVWRVPAGEPWKKQTRLKVRYLHYPQCPIFFDDPDPECRSKSLQDVLAEKLAA